MAPGPNDPKYLWVSAVPKISMAFKHASNQFKGVRGAPNRFPRLSRESLGNPFENPRNTIEHIRKAFETLGRPLAFQKSRR